MKVTLDHHEIELLIEAAQLCDLRLEVHTEGDYVATLWNGSARTPMTTWPLVGHYLSTEIYKHIPHVGNENINIYHLVGILDTVRRVMWQMKG